MDELSAIDFNLNQIKVYPNPVSDLLYLNIPAALNTNSIELFDIQGRLITSFDVQSELDFSGIQQGVYMLKLKTTKGDFIQKVIKD